MKIPCLNVMIGSQLSCEILCTLASGLPNGKGLAWENEWRAVVCFKEKIKN